MFKNKKILVVVPARGGSKGITKKNLRLIGKKTLIQIVAECVRNINFIDEVVLSSDSTEIINEGNVHGLKSYFKRPEYISGDLIGDVPVLQHSLIETEKYNKCKYDVVVMLQPTAPLRNPGHVEDIIKKLINEDLDSVWTVHQVEKQFHPDKQLKINNVGYLDFYTTKGSKIIARQELDNSYIKNGLGYAVNRETLIEKASLLGKKSGFVIHKGPIINIDTEEDLLHAENLINKINKK